ncbi:hypothetical protein [Aeromonas phage 4_4512]|nr:hypothetical protein [Aeromonas phage 4_4512]
MADILVTSPYRPFTLPNQFKAVFNGSIYCGTVDAVDPSNSQVQVYKVNEDGSRIPVAQPLRTNAGGYLVYNGQPAKFVTDSNHSLLVKDSLQAQVWYAPDMAAFDPESLLDILGASGGVELVGDAVAYLSSLAALAAYDGGKAAVVITDPIDGGVFVVDANASLSDPVIAVLAANGNKYKRLYELKSARFYGVSSTRTDNAVQLNAAANSGGRVVIPGGVTLFNSEILTDYSDPSFPDEINPSSRTVIAGESICNTLLSYGGTGYAIKRIGLDIDQPAAQGIHSNDGLENFTLFNRNTFLGEGVYLQNKAHMRLDNLRMRNFDIGISLVGCLSSSLNNIYADTNNIGILIRQSSFTAPNALHMSSIFAKNNKLVGISGLLGAGNKISGFTVEGNGTTAGDISQGGILLELSGGNGSAAIDMSSGYFEANCGIADLQLINVTSQNITVRLSEVLFRRDSNVRFTTNNIVLRSLGGGTLTLITDGCTFESVGTYVPSASRPFVDYGEACNWIDRGSTFSETTSLSGGPALGYRMPTHGYSRFGQVSADGTVSIGANGISVVREAVGTYLISCSANMPKAFGSLVGSYIATATANGQFAVNATCDKVSERSFRVHTRLTTDGGLVDIEFSWEVNTIA